MTGAKFDELMTKLVGHKITSCPKCGELLAHRKGVPLPCTKCTKEKK